MPADTFDQYRGEAAMALQSAEMASQRAAEAHAREDGPDADESIEAIAERSSAHREVKFQQNRARIMTDIGNGYAQLAQALAIRGE